MATNHTKLNAMDARRSSKISIEFGASRVLCSMFKLNVSAANELHTHECRMNESTVLIEKMSFNEIVS